MARGGLTGLRTGVSWADCHTPAGAGWYDWLLPRLTRDVELLPCFTYTPPSLGIAAKSAAPPRVPKAYADFLDVIVTRHGRHFAWVELWHEHLGRQSCRERGCPAVEIPGVRVILTKQK